MRSHTVPRSYLAGFAEKTGLVVVDPRRSPEEALRAQRPTKVDDVSVRDDYYAVRRSTGLDQGPEQSLDRMEKRIWHLRKALRAGPLSLDDLSQWTRLAGAQFYRGRHRSAMAATYRDMMDGARKDANARGVDPDEAVREYVRANIYPGDADPDPDNLALLSGIDVIKLVLTWFNRMYKCVLTSRDGAVFIASDEPVALFDPVAVHNYSARPVESVSQSANCEVTYPLDRRHCLVMAYRRIVSDADADEDAVETVNARTAGFCKEMYVPPCGVRGQDAVLRALRSPTAIFRSLAARYAMPDDAASA
jgi:hypothetical protein